LLWFDSEVEGVGMVDRNRSREELLADLETTRRKLAEAEAAARDRDQTEHKLRALSRELDERIKEINCLYGISKLRDQPSITTDELLQGIVDLIPAAWQYPPITHARVTIPNGQFQTENFSISSWRQSCSVLVGGECVGSVEVYYAEQRPEQDEGPFLKEERSLLEAICERVGKILEWERAKEQARHQQQQLIQLDKMAALGTMVSGVAHEINNPNNFIMLNAPVLLDAFRDVLPILNDYYRDHGDFVVGGIAFSEMRESIPVLFSGILDGSKRIESIVNSLKSFARTDAHGLVESVDINEVVESAIHLLNNHIRKSTKRFSILCDEPLPLVRGNFQRLEQVVVNLVQNACEALLDNEKSISVATRCDRGDKSVVIEVSDEGIGIPEERLPHITDPFNTTKRNSGGLGLGLSVSAGIVKDHGGSLSFSSTLGQGTIAAVRLPIAGSENRDKESR
jgi:C4-dicarboxylate-specific signal transduction histidine kinase